MENGEKTRFSKISISVDEAELAYLRAKQQEGYGISQFIRVVLERERVKDEVRKQEENQN
jgi:hypothetical protein